MIYYEEMAYAIKKGYHSQDLQGELVSWRPRAADDIVWTLAGLRCRKSQGFRMNLKTEIS